MVMVFIESVGLSYIFECVKNGHVCITAGVGRDGWGDAKGVFDF